MRALLVEPTTEQILAYCALEPVERVFLEDVARRGHGRFAALEREDGELQALCHLGTNVVPSGYGSSACWCRRTLRSIPPPPSDSPGTIESRHRPA